MTGWRALQTELAHWRAENLALPFWWRDDDAVTTTTALDRLTNLADQLGVPAHLAVVPKFADRNLAAACTASPVLIPLVHGWAHENHAPLLQKKAEFGHNRPGLMQDALQALQRIDDLFGRTYLPCFVPPWNRISPLLTRQLADLGYNSVSTFTPRHERLAAPGLVQVNTHIDPINWRGGRGVVDLDTIIAQTLRLLQDRRNGQADQGEPLGLLTHHLVHDGAIWDFTDRLLQTMLDAGATPLNLFDLKDNLP